MDEPVAINTLCPACEGSGEVRMARVVVSLGSGRAGTALVIETCKTCGGDGKLKGFTPPA